MMTFSTGSLVRVRGREWVVLPNSQDDLLMLRPLGGTDAEVTGIYLPLEPVEAATFTRPDPAQLGDARSGRLLREAVRLGLRAGAGPFRSFGRLNFDPRPYQLVPLLMALRLDPVRMLIADDVGIGKTVEAGLIARELLDRGEIERLAVVCPPQLAEQWQKELAEKFQLQAELVLASTAARLERPLGPSESIFDAYPFTIVSLDFIKSKRRRDDFLRAGPELIIVDEAHNSAADLAGRGRRQQRFELLRGLAARPDRHLILMSATPHSGNEGAFRSLLSLLRPEFADLPDDLGGETHRRTREQIARHLVQRRRADIADYLGEGTPFPQAVSHEETYRLSPGYKRLIERALEHARRTASDETGTAFVKRLRWWSALALLRALSSSPAAAVATLSNRAGGVETAEDEAIATLDALGRQQVLDGAVVDESSEGVDVEPGAELAADEVDGARRALHELKREAQALRDDPAQDAKLSRAVDLIKKQVKAGQRPIVFCRFIATAEYVGAALRRALPKAAQVEVITGALPPAEREARVDAMGAAERRVLVCTDCLSEGVNLQALFDTVFHYDLLWNPTRHAQREGRVDRYGQRQPEVHTVLYYGADNPVDGMVMDVLLRKHEAIRSSLGVSVPVPLDGETVMEAIFEGLLLRRKGAGAQSVLPGFEEVVKPEREAYHARWDAAVAREKRSRTVYAQAGIKPDEVAPELAAAREAVGSSQDLAWFVRAAVRALGGVAGPVARGPASSSDGPLALDLCETPAGFRHLLGDLPLNAQVAFSPPAPDTGWMLHRGHPLVEALAAYITDTALDPKAEQPAARRCGVMRTASVARRTTLLMLRARYHLAARRALTARELLAEEAVLLAFTGSADAPVWLPPAEVDALLAAEPASNIMPEQARDFVFAGLADVAALEAALADQLQARAEALRAAHQRVRSAAAGTGGFTSVALQLPFDLVGLYVYLPAGAR